MAKNQETIENIFRERIHKLLGNRENGCEAADQLQLVSVEVKQFLSKKIEKFENKFLPFNRLGVGSIYPAIEKEDWNKLKKGLGIGGGKDGQ